MSATLNPGSLRLERVLFRLFGVAALGFRDVTETFDNGIPLVRKFDAGKLKRLRVIDAKAIRRQTRTIK